MTILHSQSSLVTKYFVIIKTRSACLVASVVSDSVILWAVAHQAPLSMGFSRQEYWGGLPCPPPGDLPEPEIEPASYRQAVLFFVCFFTTTAIWETPP